MLCCFLKAKQNDLGNILLGDLFWEVILCYVHEYCRNFRCGCPPVTGSYFIPAWWCSMFTSLTTCSIKIVLVPLCPEYEWNFVHWGSWAWNMGQIRDYVLKIPSGSPEMTTNLFNSAGAGAAGWWWPKNLSVTESEPERCAEINLSIEAEFVYYFEFIR